MQIQERIPVITHSQESEWIPTTGWQWERSQVHQSSQMQTTWPLLQRCFAPNP